MGVSVLQPWHVIVILVIVLVIFGPGKLPMLGKAIGDTERDFKKAVGDEPKPGTPTGLAPGMRECPTCHKPVAVADRDLGLCRIRTSTSPEPRVIWQAAYADVHKSARVRAFLDFAQKRFGKPPYWDPDWNEDPPRKPRDVMDEDE